MNFKQYDYKQHPTKEYIYWVYDNNADGFYFFKTAEERDDFADEECIKEYLDDCMWNEEVENIYGGMLTHVASQTNIQKPVGELDKEGYDKDGEYWGSDLEYRCNYELRELK